MSEANPIMVMIFEHNNFVSESEEVEAEIQPLDEQQAFGPGDAAILASSNAPLEQDFTVARGIDPEKYTETYADWDQQERMVRDHVLCEFFSRADSEISVGWVHRLKLLPVKNYRYKEMRRWRKNGWPDEPPEWVMKLYRLYTDQLAERAPNRVPVAIACPSCKKRNVDLVVTRRLVYSGRAGLMKIGDQERHVPIEDVSEPTSSHSAKLVCRDCKADADLTDDEWLLPDISN